MLPSSGPALADDGDVEEVVVTGIRRRNRINLCIGCTGDPDHGQTELSTKNPQGNYCPVGENADGSCSEPETTPPNCPGSSLVKWRASRDCVCAEGEEKVEEHILGIYTAYCSYTPPSGGISGNIEAVQHYFRGNGAEVEIHKDLKDKLETASEVLEIRRGLVAGTALRGEKKSEKLDVDMTWSLTMDTFFIGDTTIYYNTKCKGRDCITTFTWGPDSFSDPTGLGFEVPWGTPYNFATHSWPFRFTDPTVEETEAPADE